ncbi:MAG TPA: division/cell wall cluster transcriptional repressor MraZ [Solirubrobacterales bacterium]
MAFRGQHEHTLDSKDRLTIPSRLRAQLADGAVLLAGLDPCVEIWPRDGFAKFTERFLAGLNPLSSKARMLRRRFHANAQDEELDSAGRVRIAKHLIEHAGLEGACVVVGVEDHLEVWNPERWAQHAAEIDAQAGAMAEELAGFDLGGEE